mgnify:CR=1 FL=1
MFCLDSLLFLSILYLFSNFVQQIIYPNILKKKSMKIKSFVVLLALGLSACSGGKYAGVPKEYHELLNQTMVTAGDNAKELTKALKRCQDVDRRFPVGERVVCL